MKYSLAIVLVAFAAVQGASAWSFSSEDTWHPNAKDFYNWMAEGGFPLTGKDSFVSMRTKFIKRVSKFAQSRYTASPSVLDKVSSRPEAGDYPYFGFIPPHVGSLVPNGDAVTWSASCFNKTTAKATVSADGNVTLTLTLEDPTSLLCSDMYLFATLEGVQIKTFFWHGTHTITWKVDPNATPSEVWDLKTKGIRAFRFLDTGLSLIWDIIKTISLFIPETTKPVSKPSAEVNLDFLSKYANVEMKPRTQNIVPVDESLIQSGDFLGVIRLDGLDPMLAWAMGSTTGHTTVALRVNGKLHIAESTVKDSYWPVDGIQITPFDQWIQNANDAGYNVVWAPLSAKYRAKFNETAAYARFLELEGFEYGYRNLFYGWIDTLKDNYPCLPPHYDQCLQWEHVELLYAIADRLLPSVANMAFGQAFNLRLNTTGLSAPDVLYTAYKKGISANALPTLVEKDSFVYNTTRHGKPAMGPSMVCCVFVCNMWKSGGIFEEIGDEVNCAELTNFDDYAMTVIDPAPKRPSACISADPDNKLCQLVGNYTLNLNNLSSYAMHPWMDERCPSLDPHYQRPKGC